MPDRRRGDRPARAARPGRDVRRRPAGAARSSSDIDGEDRGPARRSWRPDAAAICASSPGPSPAAPPGSALRAVARRPRPALRQLAGLDAERAARHPDDGPRGAGAALEHGRRHADPGPGAARRPVVRSPAPGVRPGHEPADRPRARAGVMDLRSSSAADRRCSDGCPTAPPHDPARPAGRRRPATGSLRAHRGRRAASAGSMRPGGRPTAPPGSPHALERLARRRAASPSRRAGRARSSSPTRPLSLDRLPVPSVLAVGAVHTALTGAGLRGRADIVVDAGDASTSTPRRCSSRRARPRSVRGWRSSWRPSSPGAAAPRR